MKINKLISIAGVLLIAAAASGQVNFSVANGGPSGLLGNDIYAPGPTLVLPGSGPGIEVNAISGANHPMEDIFAFSVDHNSFGLPGTDVEKEAILPAPGDQPADIYWSGLTGNNTLMWDGDGAPNPLLAPSLGLVEQPSPADNLDGLELHGFVPSIFYSLDLASAPGGAADVMVAPASPGYDVAGVLYANWAALGLQPGDDIDALVVFDDGDGIYNNLDYILFSVAPGSSVGGSADIFRADAITPGSSVFITAGQLGLQPSDNLDALDVIPEPNVIVMILMSGGGMLFIRRKFMI